MTDRQSLLKIEKTDRITTAVTSYQMEVETAALVSYHYIFLIHPLPKSCGDTDQIIDTSSGITTMPHSRPERDMVIWQAQYATELTQRWRRSPIYDIGGRHDCSRYRSATGSAAGDLMILDDRRSA